MILAPRIGYLPLLVAQIKLHFSGALPPGQDTIWFDFNGLPLRWYIPIGVLFYLLCPEPQRPWNLTAAFILNGNCENIMSISQSDQIELWCSVLNGAAEFSIAYDIKMHRSLIGNYCRHNWCGDTIGVVPPLLALEISEIVDELQTATFEVESRETEAKTLLLALLEQTTSTSDCIEDVELKTCLLVTSGLNITTRGTLRIEKGSIKKLLYEIESTNVEKRKILKYFLYLLMKYGNAIQETMMRKECALDALCRKASPASVRYCKFLSCYNDMQR